MAPLTDTHLHLTDYPYADTVSDTLEKTAHNGVLKVIVPGYSPESLKSIGILKQSHPQIAVAIGYHPGYITSCETETPDLQQYVSDVNPVAIGETGLDARKGFPPMSIQQTFFCHQIELALELNLPLVIHCVGAHPECLSILRRYAGHSPLRGVLHRVNCSVHLAEQYIDIGFYLGFGPELFDVRRGQLQLLAKQVPPKHILLETDAPYCKNRTGDIYHPWDLPHLAEHFAGMRNITFREMEHLSEDNTHHLFGI